MSNASKTSIFILIGLLVVSLGVTGYVFLEKTKVEQERTQLGADLQQAQDREKKSLMDIRNLKDQLSKLEEEKSSLESKLRGAQKQAEDLQGELANMMSDRDSWKAKVDSLKGERDALVAQIQTLSQPKVSEATAASALGGIDPEPKTIDIPVGAMPTNEDEWAAIFKAKAELEVKLEDIKRDFSKSSVEIVELKKAKEELELEIDKFKHDQEDLRRDIQYKEDLVNNLSLELARTKNDRKFIATRVAELNEENDGLRQQLKRLVTSKGALEKSIVHLTDEKSKIQKQLDGTEGLIQSKIDEIWEIKESLDKTFKESRTTGASNEVELPPIVVSSGEQAINFNAGLTSPGYNGKVVSVNEDNNFVIVDIGESAGVKLGEVLSVYRDSKYVARLEVIQVRKDISAADIKEQWSKIKAGDVVK
jgi:chromosome segregation ATPase